MNPDLRSLITLQDLDQKIAALQKQISEIPDTIKNLQQELESASLSHAARVSHSQELSKRRRAREGDVDLLRARLSKLRDQLMLVKTNREYTAMLHEIEIAEQQIRSEEDEILEMMEELESLEEELRKSAGELKSTTADLEGRIRSAEASVPSLESEVENLLEERRSLEKLIQAELLSRYRRIAEARKGVGLAEARDELCSACHVRIRPQVFADLIRTDEIHVCDSCSRILFLREAL